MTKNGFLSPYRVYLSLGNCFRSKRGNYLREGPLKVEGDRGQESKRTEGSKCIRGQETRAWEVGNARWWVAGQTGNKLSNNCIIFCKSESVRGGANEKGWEPG